MTVWIKVVYYKKNSEIDIYFFTFTLIMNLGKGGCVYILTNNHNTVLYVGVTSDLYSRIIQHKEKYFKNSFTDKYNCTKLVFYRFYESIEEVIIEEKKLKAGNRQKKINLILSLNENWEDLWDDIKNW